MFNFSPFIPVIFTVVMIIYGVLTELGNTADTETLQYVPYSCWDCHHLLLLFWKILKDFSFHCLVWIGVNRAVFPKGKSLRHLQYNQFGSCKNRCWDSTPDLLSQNLRCLGALSFNTFPRRFSGPRRNLALGNPLTGKERRGNRQGISMVSASWT